MSEIDKAKKMNKLKKANIEKLKVSNHTKLISSRIFMANKGVLKI